MRAAALSEHVLVFVFGDTNVSILFEKANKGDDLLDEIIYTDGS